MIKCERCGSEYLPKDEVCPNCGFGQKGGDRDWEYLTTVANDIEFSMIEGVLKMAEIPATKKLKGIDGYMNIILGIPIAGVDIYVPQDRLDEALELINSEVSENEETEK